MAYIPLKGFGEQPDSTKLKIMIFTEGTVLGPHNKLKMFRFSEYAPIGNCVRKIAAWKQQGAEIVYCTSRRSGKQVKTIAALLDWYTFAGSRLYYREGGQTYGDIVLEIRPDILIEDNCIGIGGAKEMCITQAEPELKSIITSVVVAEFMGIDHLPEMISEWKD